MICIKGSVAYVSQVAWTMNATLRANVLFCKEFEKVNPVLNDSNVLRYY